MTNFNVAFLAYRLLVSFWSSLGFGVIVIHLRVFAAPCCCSLFT